MRIIALLLLAAVSALQAGCGALSPEGVVQAVVIDSLFIRDTTRQVVVGDSTVGGGSHFVDEDYRTALEALRPLPDGVQKDFEAKRSTVRQVDSLSTKVPMRRFTATDRAALRAHGNPTSYWNAFYQRFPASPGLVVISRVGFGRDGASALLLVEHGCGKLCGGTMYVLLARQSGRWRVTRTAQPRIA